MVSTLPYVTSPRDYNGERGVARSADVGDPIYDIIPCGGCYFCCCRAAAIDRCARVIASPLLQHYCSTVSFSLRDRVKILCLLWAAAFLCAHRSLVGRRKILTDEDPQLLDGCVCRPDTVVVVPRATNSIAVLR